MEWPKHLSIKNIDPAIISTTFHQLASSQEWEPVREATTSSVALESGEPEGVQRFADPDSQPILSQRLVFDDFDFQADIENALESAEAPPLPAPAEEPSLPNAPSEIPVVVEASQQTLPEPEVAKVVPPATSLPPEHNENDSAPSLHKSKACEERVMAFVWCFPPNSFTDTPQKNYI